MVVQVLKQTLELSPVDDVVVTAVEHDDDAGDYFRDIKFFGVPAEGETTAPELLVVRIRAATAAPLKVTVPISEF